MPRCTACTRGWWWALLGHLRRGLGPLLSAAVFPTGFFGISFSHEEFFWLLHLQQQGHFGFSSALGFDSLVIRIFFSLLFW